jgi:hypothetical protein
VFTPLAFSLIIAKQFYHPQWEIQGRAGRATTEYNLFDLRLFDARVECELLADQYFSADEKKQFFFA